MFPSVGKNLMIEGVFDPTVSDVEEVMRLQPDAVILSWNPGLVDPLKNAGVSGVVEIAWSRQGVHDRDHQEMWKLIGSITGKSLRTQFLLGRYAKVREQVMAVLPPRAAVPLKVAALESSDLAILGSKQLWLNDELEAVGVQNIGPGTGQAFSVDPEELMRLDPDVILLLHESNDDLSLGMFYAKPEYQSLKAIRNRHVYVVPMYSFSNQFLEEPLLLDWLAEILYQDAMPRRLRNEYRHTYAEIFQYSLSDSDIDKAIYLKENSQSAGYERFVSQVVRLNSAARAH
jgi:ABC-type Fe3+-hydroxamate transport system substrate-binding protein